MRVKLGLAALGVLAAAGCAAQPAAAPVVTPPAATQSPDTGQSAQSAQGGQSSDSGSSSTSGSSTSAADLGSKRSSDGGYWPLAVQLGQNSTLGPIVVDGQGFTLYRFDKDTAKPPKSNCSGTCAATWPPVLINDQSTFQNLDKSELGTVQRADGTQQLTVGGWPAYRYINDSTPGQTTGQGVGKTWFVLAPDGTKAGGGKATSN